MLRALWCLGILRSLLQDYDMRMVVVVVVVVVEMRFGVGGEGGIDD